MVKKLGRCNIHSSLYVLYIAVEYVEADFDWENPVFFSRDMEADYDQWT